MRNTSPEYITIGKLGSTYGIKGWLKVNSFTESVEDILRYQPWYLEEKDSWQPVKVLSGRMHGKGIVVHLAGLESPEQARLLTGKKIAIKRSQLPDLTGNDYYWDDLIGLAVVNNQGQTLGIVSYLLETGSNDVLVIKDSNNREHGIPYLINDVITRVDLVARVIEVNWDLV